MTPTLSQLPSLYIVATPIGNLGDMSYRAIEILKQVDVIATEDTRHSARLLKHFDIATPMLALHEHNEATQFKKILLRIQQGQSVALISDAGTPLVSDPGYRLTHEARKLNIPVIPIPGSCAAITALSASGLPSDRFIFEGFLPAKQNARLQRLTTFDNETRTMIFYEAPHRVLSTLKDMIQIFGENRHVVIARELTKLHETIHDDSLSDAVIWLENNTEQQRGEFVILVEGSTKIKKSVLTDEDIRILKILLESLPTKQAASLAAKITGKNKNVFYKIGAQTYR